MSNGYYKISSVGDTTINTIPCKILEKTLYEYSANSGTFDTTYFKNEYTYSDGDRIYIYRFNKFYTLYDFSASIGDTIIIPGTNKYSASGCDSVGAIKVDSTGIMNINSENLRYISVSPTATSKWGWHGRIVEKTGPVLSYPNNNAFPYSYLFPVKLDNCGMQLDEYSEGGSFRCYSNQSGLSYHPDLTDNCDYIYTDFNEFKNSFSEISITPNPTDNLLYFHYRLISQNPVRIEIYDTAGNLCFEEYNNATEDIRTYSLSSFPSGIYLIKVNSDQSSFVQKFIKY